MDEPMVEEALARIREAMRLAEQSWPELPCVVAGQEGTVLRGAFVPTLPLEPGTTLPISAKFDVPTEVGGIPLAGEQLLLSIFSLYPMRIAVDGRQVFEDTGVPVAAGPALVTAVESLEPGRTHEVDIEVIAPAHDLWRQWIVLGFTTPAHRERFEVLDLAGAQLVLAKELAEADDDRAALCRAAAVVPDDIAALTTDRLADALAEVPAALGPLGARAADLTVHLVGHSHIDICWLWTWEDTVEVVRRDFRSIVSLLDDYPEMRFTHSQPVTYEVAREHEEVAFDRVRELVKAGRWEPATMQWVEGDLNMSSGEAQAMHLLTAVRWARETLGVSPTTFLAPDTFGHSGQMPQLVRSAGGDRYYHCRANPGKDDQWPAYWWEGEDGTRILAMSTTTYNGSISAGNVVGAAIAARRNGGLPVALHFYGVGDHGGGPVRQDLDFFRRIQGAGALPNVELSSLEQYADAVLATGVELPTHRGESHTLFEGCYTTHGDAKQHNRDGENALLAASALAALAGVDACDELGNAWRALLFHTFHDILCGAGVGPVYDKTAADAEAVRGTADAVAARAMPALAGHLPAGHIAVVNPLGLDRADVVTVRGVAGVAGDGPVAVRAGDGTVLPAQRTADGGVVFVADVPAWGAVAYEVVAADHAESRITLRSSAPPPERTGAEIIAPDDRAGYFFIDTPAFDATVRMDCGVITSLIDKRADRQLVAFGARRPSDYIDDARPDLALNVLQFVEEHPHAMSAWSLCEVFRETSLIRGGATKVVEEGPVRVVLETEHDVEQSRIVMRTTFYADLERIDVEAHIDWNEVGSAERGVPGLKAAFTARIPEAQAWYETPFAAAQRPADGQEVPALRWADVGNADYGIAVVNDGRSGYDALGPRLRLSLLRSGYDPDSQSAVGRHRVRWSLVPHAGTWREGRVVDHASSFNVPLVARVATGPSVDAPVSAWRPETSCTGGARAASLKPAYDGDGVVVRVYDAHGDGGRVTLSSLPEGASVFEVNVVEDRVGDVAVEGGAVTLDLGPWQIRTVKVVIGQ